MEAAPSGYTPEGTPQDFPRAASGSGRRVPCEGPDQGTVQNQAGTVNPPRRQGAVRVPAEYSTRCDVTYGTMITTPNGRNFCSAEHCTEYPTACGGGHVRRTRLPLWQGHVNPPRRQGAVGSQQNILPNGRHLLDDEHDTKRQKCFPPNTLRNILPLCDERQYPNVANENVKIINKRYYDHERR